MNTPKPLAGFRLAVTSDRRSAELIEAFERRGAEVTHTPLLQLAPLDDEQQLISQTQKLIEARPQIVVITTAYGLRRWVDTAEAAGLGDQLLGTLGQAQLYVRGAKAHGTVKALGLEPAAVAKDGRSASMLTLLEGKLQGLTVALQLHADSDHGMPHSLRELGASRVLKVEPYRWQDTSSDSGISALVEGLCAAHFDAVTFTSAPSVHALFAAAKARNRLPALLRSLAERVVVATVGPVTAAPLIEAGISPLVPERHRMGAMIGQLVEHLGSLGTLQAETVFGPVQLRGRTFSVQGQDCELTPGQAELVRALIEAGGSVLSRDELGAAMPEASSKHALDMTLSRLRKALPQPEIIATVIKRGYRLNA
ncbi:MULTISPECIES: uroporphyrinogen-III synthase [Glutamicibacter]|jgi:uroporphyrinogen-III synthase|uniref:uroporphyrinogen-III synthase n=1 Tax=Glutamicibacter TaxID=1742989 RepID=UPI003F90B501